MPSKKPFLIHRCIVIALAVVAALPITLLSQDTELTNYKTGIDVTFSGTKGADYMEEYFYHDKLITDRKVVYIRDTTLISMAHNARNVASLSGTTYNATIGINGSDGSPNTGDEGIIRYRVDKDMHWGPRWGDGGANNNPAYTAPFTLASLQYEAGVPVVGTTGPKPGTDVANYTEYYWRGHIDPYGDEWHVIAVADDDSAFATGDNEFRASDGKLIHFVVNPKTPALTIRTTGNAQFYTTPPKAYFVPKIHAQTTYISPGSGSVTFELKDIYGNNVFYRINGGSWNQASNPSISDTSFNDGTNTLEYYYAGNQAYTKTRTVIKNPGFPSAAESHGNLLWKDAAGYNEVSTRLAKGDYLSAFNFMRTNNNWNNINAHANLGQGRRTQGAYPDVAAFVALRQGWSSIPSGKSKSYAQYAKESLLDNHRALDPVGSEINHSNTLIPTRELYYRGYYDFNLTFRLVLAYDILIANYKSTQHAGGITPIEDYFIRDQLAGCAFEAMMQCGHWFMKEYPNPGMWGTARNIAGLIVAMVIPSYSTPYYGTSGFDGNTTVYPWTPFPDSPQTWKKVLLDGDAPLPGYPNLKFRLGADEYLVNSEGQWLDRVPYWNDPLMGHCFMILLNLTKMYTPSKNFPNLEAGFVRASLGTLMGLKDNSGPSRYSSFRLYNNKFPVIAANSHAWMLSLNKDHLQSIEKQWLRSGITAFAWYDDTYFGSASPVIVAPTNAQVAIDVVLP